MGPDVTSAKRISEKETKAVKLGDIVTFGQPNKNPQHQFLHVEERELLGEVVEPSQVSHHLPVTEREKMEGIENIDQYRGNTKGSQTPPKIRSSQPSQGTMPRIPEEKAYNSLHSPHKGRTDDLIDNYGPHVGGGGGAVRRGGDVNELNLPPLDYIDIDDDVSIASSQRSASSNKQRKYISIDYESGTIHIDPAPPRHRDTSRGRSRSGGDGGVRRSSSGRRQQSLRSRSRSPQDSRYISPNNDAGRGRYDMYMGSSRGFDAASEHGGAPYLGATRIPDDQLEHCADNNIGVDPRFSSSARPQSPIVQGIKKFPTIEVSPSRESPIFNNLAPHQFSELELALDPKSAQYLRNWDPRSGLSPHQKENLENYGNKAAQMTLIVNKMKAGVIPYEESERLLQEIVTSSGKSAGRRGKLGESMMGTTSAPLTRPPVMDDPVMMNYKYVILGDGSYEGSLIDLNVDLRERAKGIPNDVKREALAEFDGRTCRFVTEVADKFEVLYHELRTFIAPDSTGPRLGATAENYFSNCKAIITKNKEVLEAAFQTQLFINIEINIDDCPEFRNAYEIMNKTNNLYDFVCNEKDGLKDIRDDSHIFITQIKDDHYKILLICNVLYDLIQEISKLQQNLERLDKLLEYVATEFPRNVEEVRKSQMRLENAQMNNGELDLSGSQSIDIEAVKKKGPTLAELGPKLIPKLVKFLRRKRQIQSAEEKVRLMNNLRLIQVKNVDKTDTDKFIVSFQSPDTIVRKSFKAWTKALLMHMIPKYGLALEENKVKEDLISGMQRQMRKAVGDLHEFESRSDVHGMLVAERALNRELKQTNYEVRNQLYYAQEKFLTHMNVDKEKIADLLKADQLQQLTDLRVENNFLREKLNKQLGKTEVSTGGKRGYQDEYDPTGYNKDGDFPTTGLPVGSNFNALPNPSIIRAQGNKNRLARIPRVSKEIAMKLVLAEVSRLSSGYITMKQQVDKFKRSLAEEVENNKANTMALHKQSEANLNKDRGLMALKKILFERYGKAETDALLHQLDINGWCDLFSNSFEQLVNPPTKIDNGSGNGGYNSQQSTTANADVNGRDGSGGMNGSNIKGDYLIINKNRISSP